MIQKFKLIKSKNITKNVFEMVFQWENELKMLPWQFITFLLESIGWRAYSILRIQWDKIILIIKKRELSEWGRWWSKLICELNIWDTLKWVWPAGHFILKENSQNKLFIWTGTGLVPLYNMITSELDKKNNNKVMLTFWVREKEDLFYLNKLEQLKSINSNFDYDIYISRVKDLHEFKIENWLQNINSGYTTNFITKKNVSDFKEVYICWAPTMIESTVEKLKKLNFNNENIYFEKY